MSVFGRATFSAAGYAAARPSYPPILFRRVLDFHNAPAATGTLLDLGCGHGLIARALSPHFAHVDAVDPSGGMIKQASQSTDDPKITFHQSSSEELSFLEDNSVDMVVSGQAAHWFDYSRVWPELARVVRPGGSLAFWGYKDNILIGHARANRIFDHFCYGDDDVSPGLEGMNRYWERPGREILRRLLREVVPPESDWHSVERVECDIDATTMSVPSEETAWLQKRITLGGFESYVRTFSSFQGWKDAHPDMKSRAEGGEGDLADMLMDRIVESEPAWKALGDDGWRDVEVETVWGTYILLAKRR